MNGGIRLGGVVLLAAMGLALAGCPETEKPITLKDGFEKYNARQVEESEAIADKLIVANPQSPTIDEAYYLRGLSRMTRGNKIGAAADFKVAIGKTVRSDLKSKAWRALGDMAYEQSQWSEAQKDYEAAIAAGGMNAATLPYLNYRIGASLQAQGEWSRAALWLGRAATTTDPAAKEYKDQAMARMSATAYKLQFGAFIDAAKARELATQVKTAGMPADVVADVREGQVLYLVQAGAYRTMAEATGARDGVSARYPVVRIVP